MKKEDRLMLTEALSDVNDGFIREAAHPEEILGKRYRGRFFIGKVGLSAACLILCMTALIIVPLVFNRGNLKDNNNMSPAEQGWSDIGTQIAEAAEDKQDSLSFVQASSTTTFALTTTTFALTTTTMAMTTNSVHEAITTTPHMTTTTTPAMTTATTATSSPSSVVDDDPELFLTLPDGRKLDWQRLGDGNAEIAFSPEDGTLYAVRKAKKGSELTIPAWLPASPDDTLTVSRVTKLADGFFDGCTEVSRLVLPASITSIEGKCELSRDIVVVCPDSSVNSYLYNYFVTRGYTVEVK